MTPVVKVRNAFVTWLKPKPRSYLTPEEELKALKLAAFRAAVVRSAVLAVCAVVALIMGAAYINGMPTTGTPSHGLEVLDSLFGLRFWAFCWLTIGACALGSAVLGRRASLTIVSLASLSGFWALCHIFAWIAQGGRGYVAGVPFILIDVLTLCLLILPWSRRRT